MNADVRIVTLHDLLEAAKNLDLSPGKVYRAARVSHNFPPMAAGTMGGNTVRRLLWRLELWWARRWFARMTLRQAAVISAVTGAPMESVLLLHPSLRTTEDFERLSA